MRKYLITGGCGFIGSHYIKNLFLNEANIRVANIDCLTYAGKLENLQSIHTNLNYVFYKANVKNRAIIEQIYQIEKPDIVVHFAAFSHVDRSILDAAEFIETNIGGTFNMLEAARKFGVGRHITIGSVIGNTPICVRNIKNGQISVKNIDSLCPETIQNYETLVLNEQHEVVFASVKYHISHKSDLLYRIKYTGGEVTTTGNHSVFIFDDDGEITMKRTDELCKNDKLVTFVGNIDCGHRIDTLDLRKVMESYDVGPLRRFLNLAHDALRGIASFKNSNVQQYSQSVIRRLIDLEYIKKNKKHWKITHLAQVDLENELSQLRWKWIKTWLRIPNDTITITPNIARAIGLYVAEGHRGHTEKEKKRCTNGIVWTIAETETFKIKWIEELANALNASVGIFHRPKDHCQQIYISNRAIHTFFEQFGSTAYTKCVPSFIWSLKQELVQAFIEGYEGDAHIKKTKARNYTSVNIQLLTEIAWLCRLNNIDSNVCLYMVKNNCPPYCKQSFDRQYGQLAIASSNYKKQKGLRYPWARCLPKKYILQRVQKLEGRLYDYTQSLSRDAISALEQSVQVPSSIGFAKVTDVEIIEAPNTTVYDLSVPKNHTFFGGRVPILLHNTDEVYGQIAHPNSSVETDPLDPRSPYSASKASSDLLTLSYYSTFKVPAMVSRCSNNYGSHQLPEKLIPLFVTNLIEGKKVPVYGRGDQIREWIHVDDHNSAVNFVLEHGNLGEIYNIGSGEERTNLEITDIILETLGKGQDSIQHVEDRKGHDKRYSIDCSKLRNMGWKPQREFKEAMKDTITWYVNNPEWWQPIKNDLQEFYQKQYK